MRTGISKVDEKHWSTIADKLDKASKLVNDCMMILMLDLAVFKGRPYQALEEAQESLNGLAYQFTPQSEWTGGPPEANNYKIRLPHIAKDLP